MAETCLFDIWGSMTSSRNKMSNYQILAWFKNDQYERLLLVSEDGMSFPRSYAVWLETAENLVQDLGNMGVTVYCVEVDLDELAHWCDIKGYKMNHNSRLEFADLKLREALKNEPGKLNYASIKDVVISDSENN